MRDTADTNINKLRMIWPQATSTSHTPIGWITSLSPVYATSVSTACMSFSSNPSPLLILLSLLFVFVNF